MSNSKKKRNRAKQAARIAAKQEREEARTTAEKDAEKYGDVLYSVSYEIDDDIAEEAAELYGSGHVKDWCLVMLAVGIFGLVITLAMGFFNWIALIVSLILSVTGSTASGNWKSVTMWALMGTNMGASKDDVARHIVVTGDDVIVEGPGAEVVRYPLSELKHVRHNEKGCLATFGKSRIAYFPVSQMSTSRLRELEQFLLSLKK